MPGATPSATGTGQGGTVFAPPGQPTAAYNFQNVLQPEINQSISGLNALNQTPASLAYPSVQGSAFGIVNNPFAQQAQDAATGANSIAFNQTVPTTQIGGGTLAGLGGLAAGQAPGTLAAGSGAYNTLTNQAPSAFAAGNDVYNYLRQLAPGSVQAGQDVYGQLSGLAPGVEAAGGNTYGTLSSLVPGITGAGNAVAQTAFDPQSALFNRTQNQLLDQSNAINAMSGVASTPYGASVTGNNLANFDINWQNNLLNRQNTGLGALQGAGTTAGNLLSQGTGALNAGNTAGMNLTLGGLGAFNQGNTAAQNLLTGGASTLYGGNTSGSNLIGTGLDALYGGNTNLGGLINSAGSGYTGATGLYNTGGQAYLQGGTQPYTTSTGMDVNSLQALQQLIGLGNQNYALPNSVLSSLQGYLGTGQNASALANQIGNTNFNQLSGAAGGIGSLLGSGLGFGSPSNPGFLSSGLSSLFGVGDGSFPALTASNIGGTTADMLANFAAAA
jgi:hypothetical protein